MSQWSPRYVWENEPITAHVQRTSRWSYMISVSQGCMELSSTIVLGRRRAERVARRMIRHGERRARWWRDHFTLDSP